MTKETANRVIDEFREALSNINKMPNLNVLDMAIDTIRQESCEDAISRAEAIAWVENLRAMDKCFGNHKDDNFPLSTVIDQLQSVPSVTPTRKVGKWIKVTDTEFGIGYKCSECGRFILTESVDGRKLKDYPYCHCGAEMRGSEE